MNCACALSCESHVSKLRCESHLPTLPNKMLFSRVHQKIKIQSDNLMSYLPTSSYVVHYVPALVWNGDSPPTRTPQFCHSLCYRQHIHTEKNLWTFEQDMAWAIVLIHVGIQQFIKEKVVDMVSLSSLSSCGLTLFTMAYKALMIISALTTLGNVKWKWQLLCCVNLNWFWVCTVGV